jgi:hypothetical protein
LENAAHSPCQVLQDGWKKSHKILTAGKPDMVVYTGEKKGRSEFFVRLKLNSSQRKSIQGATGQ